MHKLLNIFMIVGTLADQEILGPIQIHLQFLQPPHLCIDILKLCIDVSNEAVMRDSSLCRRQHGLFLGKENVLLVLGEIASEKGLGKSEMMNLRMCEGSIAKHALGHGDVVATKERLVTGAASALGTGVERTYDGFASGRIERVKADGTGHI